MNAADIAVSCLGCGGVRHDDHEATAAGLPVVATAVSAVAGLRRRGADNRRPGFNSFTRLTGANHFFDEAVRLSTLKP